MKLRNIKMVCLCLFALNSYAEDANELHKVPFDTAHWDLSKAKIESLDGRQVLTGTAVLSESTFENGIIEMDLKTDGSRAFPGIIFREDQFGNGENIYLRPHHSGQYDAIQYTPNFNEEAGWQLYYGDGHNANLTIPKNEWMTLRIEVKDSQARVFLNDLQSVALQIPILKGNSPSGRIVIGDFGKGVYFSNFRLKNTSDLNFPAQQPVLKTTDRLLTWSISKSFAVNDPEAKNLNALLAKNNEWKPVDPESSGLINLSRYLRLVNGQPSQVYAKTVLKSDKKGRVKLEFGYSDDITIFLNKRPIFSGRAAFHSREPSFNGLIGYNDAVYIDVNKGDNEIVLQLTENFGGWGFMMRRIEF